MISFSQQSDQRAIQDMDTGRFLFIEVAPRQYAIIVWTPFGGNLLVDEGGNMIMFTENPSELKDLGIIPIQQKII